MYSKQWQTGFARLALLAMLVLAFAPSVSRWIASNSSEVNATRAEICTITGLKLVKVSDFGDSQMPKPMPMGQDCAYCPLASLVLPILLLIALIFPRRVDKIIRDAAQLSPRKFLYPSGLGSRGPPVFL
jgi:Protein of unknown function (DUF2946)